ncbi:hypothetical protein ACTHPF_20480 [Paenibacillus sp. SAF-054]|uniref:hypothetical protein n=1 Tax=unclassified Paenibacillus TaxID=185978 RepID=UPI003F80680C
MELDNHDFYESLSKKGITHLYHANTVVTSCTFIQEGGLLSRGAVEARGLVQTPQSSDDDDKRFNVWNDIFVDSVDLHERFGRQNHYGPVLFKLSLELLKDSNLPPVWVTRDNPIYWKSHFDDEDKYFSSFDEFDESYSLGNYREMITLRDTMDILPFDPYLEEIIIDNPKYIRNGKNYGRHAKLAIRTALMNSGYDYSHVTVSTRKCGSCYCERNYWNDISDSIMQTKFLL